MHFKKSFNIYCLNKNLIICLVHDEKKNHSLGIVNKTKVRDMIVQYCNISIIYNILSIS